MGSTYNRGRRAKPNWYVSYRDLDGKWKARPSRQPTKAQAEAILREIEARIARGRVGIDEPRAIPMAGPLLDDWDKSLANRNAKDDRTRLRRHVVPAFRGMRIADIDLAAVMKWIDAQRAAKKLSDASIRHNLNLLSRFFSWAVERGHAAVNPVRLIPTGKRPRQSPKADMPWLDDDAIVRKLVAELPEPVNYMFYLGNRAGLRTGELAGLRLSDLSFLDEGVIRVRFSYAGPLKEDKEGSGKTKWAPAPDDCAALLADWIARRKAAGAGPEDFLFPSARRLDRPCRKEYIESRWELATELLELDFTWYQATRHSFVSRNLAAGVSLDEVSAAVGHSSPVVTKRYYDHFVRRSFSKHLRAGLGLHATASVVGLRRQTSGQR